ncbi:MAG: hypothetical protein ACK5LV_11525 [Lachnospirales bacterium]
MSNENLLEIEKKYLIDVEKLPFSLNALEKTEIEQIYITTKPTLRIRKRNEKFYVTIKSNHNVDKNVDVKVNKELEMEISYDEYMELFKLHDISKSRIIRKNRYLYNLDNNLVVELDEFLGEYKGIYLAEIEFATVEESRNFEKPSWLLEDVSDNYLFSNAVMSKSSDPDEHIRYTLKP